MKGKVLVRHGDGGNPAPATLNTPLTSGDVITTEPGARADIALDAAHTFRLTGSGEVRLEKSEYERYQIALDKGGIVYRVSGQSAAIAAVETPNVSAAPSREGVYRMSLGHGGESEIRAETGEIMVYAPTGSIWVNEGERLRARGSSVDPEFRIYRRSRVWRRLAQMVGNIQMAAGIGSSGGSDSTSDDSSGKKSAENFGKNAARATPHAARTPTEPLRSDSAHREGAVSHGARPVEASHAGGSSHNGSAAHASSSSHSDNSSHASSSGGGSSGSSHSSSAPAAASSSSSSSAGSHGK